MALLSSMCMLSGNRCLELVKDAPWWRLLSGRCMRPAGIALGLRGVKQRDTPWCSVVRCGGPPDPTACAGGGDFRLRERTKEEHKLRAPMTYSFV